MPTMVSDVASWFTAGGDALGVRLQMYPEISLNNGERVYPSVWVLDFGAPKGTLVFESGSGATPDFRAIGDSGYTTSSMGKMAIEEPFVLKDFIDLLQEWTWTSMETLPPEWLENDRRP